VCRTMIRLFIIVSSLLGCVGAHGAEVPEGAAEQKFRAEAEDLRRSASDECRNCYFASMLGMSFPIPARYAAQLSPLEENRCVTFISPRWSSRDWPRNAKQSLLLESGMIKYCPVASLADEIAKIERTVGAGERLTRGELSVRVWRSGAKPGARSSVYITKGNEALWISDVNPHLWSAMVEAAEKRQ
jgi:hypothetical protein